MIGLHSSPTSQGLMRLVFYPKLPWAEMGKNWVSSTIIYYPKKQRCNTFNQIIKKWSSLIFAFLL